MSYLILLIAIVAEVIATSSLKAWLSWINGVSC